MAKIELSQDNGPEMPTYSVLDLPCYSGIPLTAQFDQDKLPQALKAQALIQFVPHDTDIGPKYGVQDYHKQIANTHFDVSNTILEKFSMQLLTRPPIGAAIDFVQRLKQVYTYEVRLHFAKRATGAHTEITTISPSSITMTAVKDDEIYQEKIVALWRNDIRLVGKDFGCVTSMLPYAFTNHALQRLWNRGALDGAIFHQFMAEAFLTFREHISFIMLAYYAKNRIAPNHVAIPFMSGMLIVSRRRTLMLGETKRQGHRVTRNARGGPSALDANEVGLHYERTLYDLLVGHDWFCATYLHTEDITNPRRVTGTQRHDAALGERDLTLFPYIYEQVLIPNREQVQSTIDAETADQIILAQDEMIPRKDPFDDRYYLPGKISADELAITKKWMANRQNPLL